MNDRPTITLIIPSLERGGAELVLSRLAGWLAEQGRAVSVITFAESAREWPLSPKIQRLYINDFKPNALDHAEQSTLAGLRALFAFLRPDVILSFLTRMNLRVLRSAPAEARVIVCERSYPPARHFSPELTHEIAKHYPQAHALVVQTERCAQDWAHTFMSRSKTWVLPNPVLLREGMASEFSPPANCPYIAALGRFVPEKGFLCLIDAFARLHQQNASPVLVLAGEGPQVEELQTRVQAYGLQEQVLFTGFCENPQFLLENALCFVLPSHFEGFPNALLEAMRYGTPCVASDCAAGPAELLSDERGILFPPGDSVRLAQTLLRVCTDTTLRESLGSKARLYAQQFTEEAVFTKWLRLFT